MLIGIDFDNTIVCYDNVYKKIVSDGIIVPPSTTPNKDSVKKYLIDQNQESKWTELQGTIYGPLMRYARPFPNVIKFIEMQLNIGNSISIISHRTHYPILGKKYNLHEYAKAWIQENLISDNKPLLMEDSIFFNTTKNEKINKIITLECDYFIDDLPEILDQIDSIGVKKILFAPNMKIKTQHISAQNWQEILHLIHDTKQ